MTNLSEVSIQDDWVFRLIHSIPFRVLNTIELAMDVREECGQFGKVMEVVIPRPENGVPVPGVGRVRNDGEALQLSHHYDLIRLTIMATLVST